MNNNDKKNLEHIVFWLAVAHVLVSAIMTKLNCGKRKGVEKQQKRSKSQKGNKNYIEDSMEWVHSLMNSNAFMWGLSCAICIAIAIIAGFCIWGNNDDDNNKK